MSVLVVFVAMHVVLAVAAMLGITPDTHRDVSQHGDFEFWEPAGPRLNIPHCGSAFDIFLLRAICLGGWLLLPRHPPTRR